MDKKGNWGHMVTLEHGCRLGYVHTPHPLLGPGHTWDLAPDPGRAICRDRTNASGSAHKHWEWRFGESTSSLLSLLWGGSESPLLGLPGLPQGSSFPWPQWIHGHNTRSRCFLPFLTHFLTPLPMSLGSLSKKWLTHKSFTRSVSNLKDTFSISRILEKVNLETWRCSCNRLDNPTLGLESYSLCLICLY